MFGDFCYYNRHTVLQRYTPLGIGLIAQHSKQLFGNDIKVSLFKSVDKFIDQAILKGANVDSKIKNYVQKKSFYFHSFL